MTEATQDDRVVTIGGVRYTVFNRESSGLPRPLIGVTRKTSALGPVDFFAHMATRRLFVRIMERPSLDVFWRELVKVPDEDEGKAGTA